MRAVERHRLRARRVLLVLHDDAVRGAFAMLLRHLRYEVRSASTPAAGLQQLHEEPPHLLVLDRPPGGDGSWSLDERRLRREAARSRVPLALLGSTRKVAPEDPELTAAFPEPICLEAFLEFVGRCCDHKGRATSVRGAPPPANDGPGQEVASDWPGEVDDSPSLPSASFR